MRRFLLFLTGALVLVGGGAWFWGLGSLSPLPPSSFTLQVEHAPIDVRSAGKTEWTQATDGMTLKAGDTLRTGEGGKATIHIFDQSETRLQENTEVVLRDASHDDARPEKIVFQAELVRGRIWSRVLRLFDMDSSFSIRSSDVVATVRGTSFDMAASASGTSIWVWDAVVELAPSSTGSLAIPEGYMVEKGTWAISPISETDRATDWAKDNIKKDAEFVQTRTHALEDYWKSSGISSGEQAFSSVRRLSEALHQRFSSEDGLALYTRSVERRLFAIRLLIAEGKSGLGYQYLNALEEEIDHRLASPDRQALVPLLSSSLSRLRLVSALDLPSSPQYRFKQHLEDLTERVMADHEAASLFVRLLAVDMRLDEAVLLHNAGAMEEGLLTVDVGRQGLQTIEHELKDGSSRFEKKTYDVVWAKLQALKAREEVVRHLLSEAVNVPNGTGTSPTEPGASTTTSSTIASPSEGYEKFILSAQPNPVVLGESVTLLLTGVHSDGSVVDLTSKASFSVASGTGFLSGPIFSPRSVGKVALQASFAENGETHTASTFLQVVQPKKLVGLELLSQGATSVHSGVEIPLTVRALYANGETKNVTALVDWQTTDASVGSVSDGIFYAWIHGQGRVKITAVYTEDGITESDSVLFTVDDRGV